MSARRCVITALVAVSLGVLAGNGSARQNPVFRAKATIVPLTVRVLDHNGDPVAGLTQADFDVTEDGSPRAISYFAVEDYTKRDGQAPSSGLSPVPPTERRVFVIVLGRGRLEGPGKAFDALVDFVGRTSVESDRFAVAAFDRITDITGDRSAVIRLLEHYRSEHHTIEALLDHWFRGLTDAYGAGENPPRLDALISRFFEHPGLPPSHHFGEAGSLSPPTASGVSPEQTAGHERDFIYDAAARQDLERLRATIGHLRAVEGEKHVICVTSEGLIGLTTFYQDRLAALASDARVSLSVIHTGGLPTQWLKDGKMFLFEGPSWEHRWATATSRTLAEHTGGVASIYEDPTHALNRLEKATRLHYLIGYAPPRVESKGAYRRIRVTVRRPNVTLQYRHGYFDAPQTSLSLEEERAESRISAAQMYRGPIDDIKVVISTIGRLEGTPRAMRTEIRVLPSELSFAVEDGRRVASLEVAVFVGDGGRQIGQTRRRVDLRLTPDNFAAVERDGLQFTTYVPVLAGRPRNVKAVVYDRRADRVGSAFAAVR